MPEEIEDFRVEANGLSFHIAVTGPKDGPPLLCLHGFPEGWIGWRRVMALLSDTYRLYVPELRGYPATGRPRGSYDVFTLTDDIAALIDTLQLDRPTLLTHDWGGALGWIFAHRFSPRIRQLIVVNCTHPRTLVRAVYNLEHYQTFRIPWVPFFEIPWLPEAFIATPLGRRILRWTFTAREGRPGTMDLELVDEIVNRFQTRDDIGGPIDWYRAMVATQLIHRRRDALLAVYRQPITVPTSLIWGMRDAALSARVAVKSSMDAGCRVDWRPLPLVDHFVNLEAAQLLANEVRQIVPA